MGGGNEQNQTRHKSRNRVNEEHSKDFPELKNVKKILQQELERQASTTEYENQKRESPASKTLQKK